MDVESSLGSCMNWYNISNHPSLARNLEGMHSAAIQDVFSTMDLDGALDIELPTNENGTISSMRIYDLNRPSALDLLRMSHLDDLEKVLVERVVKEHGNVFHPPGDDPP
ncbi:hypothetical protein QAD02_007366 [Eretmocerus hayati]|uniref:Uncharacterized protein n=1 Tax=Eretmocerus hayati TaxID=131215 RepID=A0ACC2N5V1_9HYME|nr:hypothetical protein QAD02_007366 [Eretmocerus hayati]